MAISLVLELPDLKKQVGLKIGLVLLAGITALTILWVSQRLERPGEVWTVAQLAQAVKQGEVECLVVSSGELIVSTKAGVRVLVCNEARVSVIELLQGQGVSEDELRNVRIVPLCGSGFIRIVKLSTWLCRMPVVLLLPSGTLGLGRTLPRRRRVR